MSYIHNLNPVLLDFGPIEIRYYGLVYVLAFVLTFFWFKHLIKKNELKLTEDNLYDLILYLMIGTLLGSRLIHILFWNPVYYLSQPWKIFFLWEGGMAFHGGIIGIAIAVYFFQKKPEIKSKVSYARLADLIMIPAVLMLAFGRLANFINGELPGTITNKSWCVVFPDYDNNCRHPQVLYSAIKRFALFGYLIFLKSKAKFKEGFIFWNACLIFGIGRFMIDFVRIDDRLLSLTAGQYLSIILTIISIIALIKYYKKDFKKMWK